MHGFAGFVGLVLLFIIVVALIAAVAEKREINYASPIFPLTLIAWGIYFLTK